jgi:hypothetical protein
MKLRPRQGSGRTPTEGGVQIDAGSKVYLKQYEHERGDRPSDQYRNRCGCGPGQRRLI